MSSDSTNTPPYRTGIPLASAAILVFLAIAVFSISIGFFLWKRLCGVGATREDWRMARFDSNGLLLTTPARELGPRPTMLDKRMSLVDSRYDSEDLRWIHLQPLSARTIDEAESYSSTLSSTKCRLLFKPECPPPNPQRIQVEMAILMPSRNLTKHDGSYFSGWDAERESRDEYAIGLYQQPWNDKR